MRRFLIVAAIAASALAMQGTAQAHWHHARHWHHWSRGPSYFPFYAANAYTYAGDPLAPVCTWHRNWDLFWHRDCY